MDILGFSEDPDAKPPLKHVGFLEPDEELEYLESIYVQVKVGVSFFLAFFLFFPSNDKTNLFNC